jgi:formate-dependent nitrite reductase membrane component NrfD
MSRRRAPEEEVARSHEGAALGTRGEPARWQRAVEGAAVQLAKRGFGDARWSYLYGDDTGYSARDADPARAAAAARRMRGGAEVPVAVQGPVMHPAVWTWEVPLYLFAGGLASGAAFAALGSDVARDRRSAVLARRVALAAALPTAPLLIMDLGRPARFLNMLRIFKPRSPMSMGAWCLVAFSGCATAAVGADMGGRPRLASRLGAGTAVLGTYLGSYTGVLLASTAVPVWARSRMLLGPIFVATATAGGAATTRLTLAADGLPPGDPTDRALVGVETAAMAAELAFSAINDRRLGPYAAALHSGRAGTLSRVAKCGAAAGLAMRAAGRLGRRRRSTDLLASALHVLSGLAFRFAWVEAGRASATDDETVARSAREPRHQGGQRV